MKMTMKFTILAGLFLALTQPLNAWSTFGSNKQPSLGKKSTALDVLTQLNREEKLAPYVTEGGVAVVTGGNTGIGAVSVKTLALAGMKVVLCARNLESAEALVKGMPSHISDMIEIQELDLADLDSVNTAAKAISDKYPKIDVLLNNAGVMAPPSKMETAQNIELQFGTNHVGHHMLTRLLLPTLKEKSRIVTVASEAHRGPSSKKGIQWQPADYSGWREYGQSKLANILFAKRLQELLIQEGKADVTSVCLHPGIIATNLWQYFPKIVRPLSKLFSDKTVEQGAATNVYLCLADNVVGAAYYSDCQVAEPTSTAEEVKLRMDLWDYTEKLIKEKGFELPMELVSNTPSDILETSAI
jgi:WW domain-containing oxidoreductase